MRTTLVVILLLAGLPSRQAPRIISTDRRPDSVLALCLSITAGPVQLTDNEAYGASDPSPPTPTPATGNSAATTPPTE